MHRKLFGLAAVGWLCAVGLAGPAAAAGTAAATTAAAAGVGPQPQGLYRLVPGDVIEIRLFYNPELNEQVQIRPDGRVSLQLLGEVEIAGQTVSEATAYLEKAYMKEIKVPSLTLQVRSFGAQKIYVTGEVNRPGMINIPAPITISEAIGEAGGVKHTGNRKVVVLLRRQPDGTPSEQRLTLYADGKPTPDAVMELEPFDVVMVPESRISRMDRWVDQTIRQMIPVVLTTGFNYLLTHQTGLGAAVPVVQ
ncbi:MAG TPA: polysaccharide biosynthesis/export family protein [Bryobacteraceae bacterium]|nr:polysaccharide biosynthesis/export family protein [Bryobacteraceae bacterium]